MPGPWKARKSKSGFPTLPTVPWKSRQQREISTFPQPRFATTVVSGQNTKPIGEMMALRAEYAACDGGIHRSEVDTSMTLG